MSSVPERGILITGSALGLGLELARVCAKAGNSIFLTDIRPEVNDVAAALVLLDLVDLHQPMDVPVYTVLTA